MSIARSIASIPVAHLRVVMRLVRAGGERSSWHFVATRYAQPGLVLDPDCMTVLRALTARGWAESEDVGGGMDRWRLTPAGDHWYDAPLVLGPLDERALEGVLIGAATDWTSTMRAWIELAKQEAPLVEAIEQALFAAPDHAARLLSGALIMPMPERERLVASSIRSRLDAVRLAILELLAPARADGPGLAQPLVSNEALDAALTIGLADPHLDVRRAAALLCFAGQRGEVHVAPLLARSEEEDSQLRYWALLALGSAHDHASLDRLHERTVPATTLDALGAFGGLAQRTDGHSRWSSLFATADADMLTKGCYALATFMRDLDEVMLRRLAADKRPGVAKALASYYARTSKP